MNAQPFEIFGESHLVTLLLILAVAFLLPFFIKNSDLDNKVLIAKVLGVSAITLELIKPFIWHYGLDFPWIKLIPIHMCNLSTYLLGYFYSLKKEYFLRYLFSGGSGEELTH